MRALSIAVLQESDFNLRSALPTVRQQLRFGRAAFVARVDQRAPDVYHADLDASQPEQPAQLNARRPPFRSQTHACSLIPRVNSKRKRNLLRQRGRVHGVVMLSLPCTYETYLRYTNLAADDPVQMYSLCMLGCLIVCVARQVSAPHPLRNENGARYNNDT